jgi:predicted phosphate transport protein (TIGR00153 family)
MNNSFFSRFMPKEPKFFPLLSSLSDVIVRAADLLSQCIDSKQRGEDIESFYKLIKEEERNGDVITIKIFNELSLTFITPFDREDIHDLANNLDDIIDAINSCAKRIMLYNPKALPKEATELSGMICNCAGFLSQAISQLNILKKNPKHIGHCCEALHDLENAADDTYAQFITDIFREEPDPVEIIKLKDIMYELEKTTDCAEHVGKILKTIVVKHA